MSKNYMTPSSQIVACCSSSFAIKSGIKYDKYDCIGHKISLSYGSDFRYMCLIMITMLGYSLHGI